MVEVTGVFTVRNAYGVGYPFVTSILSVLPATDEMFLNDGGSDDGTFEALQTISDSYNRVTLYTIPDGGPSDAWDCIDRQLNEMIADAHGEWIVEAQADEVWPVVTRERCEELVRGGIEANSIRQPRVHAHGWDPEPSHTMETVRWVRNLDDLRSYEGGDCFHIGDHGLPTEGYTNHNVQPERYVDVPFYHQHDHAREDHARRHAEWLATDHDVRQELYEDYQSRR